MGFKLSGKAQFAASVAAGPAALVSRGVTHVALAAVQMVRGKNFEDQEAVDTAEKTAQYATAPISSFLAAMAVKAYEKGKERFKGSRNEGQPETKIEDEQNNAPKVRFQFGSQSAHSASHFESSTNSVHEVACDPVAANVTPSITETTSSSHTNVHLPTCSMWDGIWTPSPEGHNVQHRHFLDSYDNNGVFYANNQEYLHQPLAFQSWAGQAERKSHHTPTITQPQSSNNITNNLFTYDLWPESFKYRDIDHTLSSALVSAAPVKRDSHHSSTTTQSQSSHNSTTLNTSNVFNVAHLWSSSSESDGQKLPFSSWEALVEQRNNQRKSTVSQSL